MGFGLWQIEWCDRHLCHVTGSDPRVTKCKHTLVVSLILEGDLLINEVSIRISHIPSRARKTMFLTYLRTLLQCFSRLLQ